MASLADRIRAKKAEAQAAQQQAQPVPQQVQQLPQQVQQPQAVPTQQAIQPQPTQPQQAPVAPQPQPQQQPTPQQNMSLADRLRQSGAFVAPEFEEVVDANQRHQEVIDPGQIGYPEDRGAIEILADDIERIGGATAGSIAGSARGAKLGARFGKPGLVLGGLAGGIVGAATGGGLGQGAKEARLVLTDRPGRAKNTDEAFERIINAAGEEAAAEALMGTLFIGGRGLFNMINPMRREIKEFSELDAMLKEKGSGLHVSQATHSAFAKGLEQVTAGSLRGGPIFEDSFLRQSKAIGEIQDELVKSFSTKSLSNEGMGRLVANTITDGRLLHKSMSGAMYKSVDDMIGKPSVNLTETTGLAKKMVKDIEKSSSFGASGKITAKLKKFIQQQPKPTTLPDGTKFIPESKYSFQDVHSLRSFMLEEHRGLKAKGKKQTARELAKVIDSLTKDMEKAAADVNPDAFKMYQKAGKFYKNGDKNLNNKFIQKLIKDEGSADRFSNIGAQIAKSPENVKLLRNAINNSLKGSGKSFKDVWLDVQGGYLGNILNITGSKELSDRGMKKLVNIATGEATRKEIETFNSMFTQGQRQAIKRFAKLIKTTEPITPSNIAVLRQAGNIIEGEAFRSQGGSLAGRVTGTVPAALFPKVFAYTLTSPKSVNQLRILARADNVEVSKLQKIIGHTLGQMQKRGVSLAIGSDLVQEVKQTSGELLEEGSNPIPENE